MAKPTAALRGMLLALCVTAAPGLPVAHEGHDHGTNAPAPAAEGARLAAQSEHFEIVAFPHGSDLIIYVDHLDSNEPVRDARVTVSAGGNEVTAVARNAGLHVAPAEWLKNPGKHALTINVAAGEQNDQFTGNLTISPPATGSPTTIASLRYDYGSWTRGLALAGFGFGAALLFRRGRKRWAGAALAVVMVLIMAASAFGQSVAQPDKSTTILPLLGDAAPHRHANGAVFLPKVTQHILGIRTIRALESEAARTEEIPGRVIADPNKSGRVQAARDGRIEAGPGGVPHLGQPVRQGEVLAYLVPILSGFEEASLRQTLTQVERDMSLLVPRADALGAVNPNMPMADTTVHMLQELQIQSQALARQKEAILATLNQKIEIQAPVAGHVSAAHITVGQVVAARDLLLVITDPSAALVEGWSFEPALAEQVAGATAIADNGRPLQLGFLGRGRVLQQQAIPLLFRVEQGGEAVAIGTPVRIVLTGQSKEIGIILPAAAVTRGAGKLATVFEHTTPETFVPRVVQAFPLDATRVMVFGDVSQGMRLVISGAGLLAQVR